MAASRQVRRRLTCVALVSTLVAMAGCAPALKLDQAQSLPPAFSEMHRGAGQESGAQDLAY
jgi:hypothetical protein